MSTFKKIIQGIGKTISVLFIGFLSYVFAHQNTWRAQHEQQRQQLKRQEAAQREAQYPKQYVTTGR